MEKMRNTESGRMGLPVLGSWLPNASEVSHLAATANHHDGSRHRLAGDLVAQYVAKAEEPAVENSGSPGIGWQKSGSVSTPLRERFKPGSMQKNLPREISPAGISWRAPARSDLIDSRSTT